MKSLLSAAPVLAAALILAGCTKQLQHLVQPNQAPTLEIQSLAPAKDANSFRLQARWSGSDPEGRPVHYVYAVNPPRADRVDATWVSTRQTEWSHVVPHIRPEALGASGREPTILVVRAVDDQGALSEPGFAGFFGGNIPPEVRITSPAPSALLLQTLPSSLTISWEGTDPDGQFTQRPVKYKYLMLSETSEFPIDIAIQNPDSLRRYYAPTFTGWDSTSAETTFVRFSRLILNENYVFVVIAIDEAGDYSPVFSLNSNMLRFRIGRAKALGPRLTLLAPGFEYSTHGGYINDPSMYGKLVSPANQRLTFNWFGVPAAGATITGYRWALDPVDIYDDTPRSSPDDLGHWSELSPVGEVTLGPFTAGPKGTNHLLFVEAHDSIGLRGLGVYSFLVVSAPLNEELLIVDDTRLTPDALSGGNIRPPTGAWPTAAELDTFLYARGGVPWRAYPVGTMSTPGLFNGYRFDTLGTRTRKADLTVPLSTLVHYRHVIWYVDGVSASYNGPGGDYSQPMTALRYMSSPGRSNTLASYIALGGKVWLAGGGSGYASMIPWNDFSNDVPTTTFSINSVRRELAPGRLMWDFAAWRSEFRVARLPASITAYTGRLPGSQYPGLPAALQAKTTATDPLPPLRETGAFYRSTFDLEFLQLENPVIEDVNPDPGIEDYQSSLDTLFQAAGSGLPVPADNPHNVVMTYYHGSSSTPFVFTGFNFWSFQRAQCQQLVDFVLQDLWGLTRSAAPRTSAFRQPAQTPRDHVSSQGVRPNRARATRLR